ncbi:MAG: stage II sporulation protein P, partial [bacterium]|nr:stage II sporulation protein P [bacterium]
MLAVKRTIGLLSVIILGVYLIVANYNYFYKAVVGAARFSILTMSFENTAGVVSSAKLKAEQKLREKDVGSAKSEEKARGVEIGEQSTAESAVETVTNGKVIGSVIEKTFSPKTSNTSFAGVNIDNKTGVTIDIEKLLNSKLGYKIEKNSQPQILIYHTHTTESYLLHNGKHYT